MVLTKPSRKAHKEAMMTAVKEYVAEEVEGKFGKNVLTSIGKGFVTKTVEVALSTKLKEHDYLLLNTTYINLDGGWQRIPADEMLAIMSDRERWIQKKEAEYYNSRYNDLLNNGLE